MSQSYSCAGQITLACHHSLFLAGKSRAFYARGVFSDHLARFRRLYYDYQMPHLRIGCNLGRKPTQ